MVMKLAAMIVAAVLLAAASPALARNPVTLRFELVVEGQPPPGATFWGQYLVEGATVPLEDPDGDGVYTGSMSGGRPVEGAGFRIVQGTGTLRTMTGLYPGEPITVIKNFGAPTIEGDTTFSARVSFVEDPATTDQYTDEDTVGGTSALPDTGGIALAALGAGVLLIAGGVLARSFARQR